MSDVSRIIAPSAMLRRAVPIILAVCTALVVLPPSASGQASNLDTVEGPAEGERTTLTMTPHVLADGLSARAVGVRSPNNNRWALTLIGASRADSIRLTMGSESLPIDDITRPEEGEVGPTRLYVSGETFLTVADTPEVRLHVGDKSIAIPEQMRLEMRKIFGKVN